MTKSLEVDVEKSLGYQANGRLKKEKVEKAKLYVKKFVCPECNFEEEADKKQFGDIVKCPKCGIAMIQQF